jgi:hypothetical protein
VSTFRIVPALADIAATDWDGLRDGDNPFLAHAFLAGLEQTGSLRPDWGWHGHHPTLWQDGELVAAAPGYLKTNSHGEFVFDHAWAAAYQHHGQPYYPKWLIAVPYSPVPGPRLLARTPALRAELIAAILTHARAQQLSSVHINFLSAGDYAALGAEWLPREDVQYHWHNPGHWRCFDDFLAALSHKKRKNIRAERRLVGAAGVEFRRLSGTQIGAREREAMYGFYLRTFFDKGNSPALTPAFFEHLIRALPEQVVLILAERDHEPIAGALCLRSSDRLFGRYWGGAVDIPGLHFETCYYQGIAYCLEHGITTFEPGAQGEHKIARGFAPVSTHSRHWIADPAFAQAIAHWCAQERASITRYREHLLAHSPFRHAETTSATRS